MSSSITLIKDDLIGREISGAVVYYADLASDAEIDADGGILAGLSDTGSSRFTAVYRYSEFWCKPFFGSTLDGVPDETQFIIAQYDENDAHRQWRVLLPLVSKDYKCVFVGKDSGLFARVFSWTDGMSECRAPLFAQAYGSDPFEAAERCAEAAEKVLNESGLSLRLRKEKRYPDILEYLGWCTWDAMQIRVSRDGILEKCREFAEKKIPVRWAVIDDMWADTDHLDSAEYSSFREMIDEMHRSSLTDIEASPLRFPGGLGECITEMRKKYGIKAGVWHPTTGYWNGIAENSPAMDKLSPYTVRASNGCIVGDWHEGSSFGYYNVFHRFLRSCGADFVKVDNQSMYRRFYKGTGSVGRVCREYHRGLEASVGVNFGGDMINCMGMASEDIFTRTVSSVSRCSNDFMPEDREWFAEHIQQCAFNSLYQGLFYYSDYDMWWSDDSQAVKNSVLRAVSGGPIYVSDKQDRSVADVLSPLTLDNGRILRCSEVGVPCLDCLTVSPLLSGKPLKIQNRAGACGVIAAFNLTSDTVSGTISPSDVHGIKKGRYAVYEHFSGKCVVLADSEAAQFTLEGYDDFRLYVIVPIEEGFAPIGFLDKYISPLTVESRIGDMVKTIGEGEFGYFRERDGALVRTHLGQNEILEMK